MKEILIDHLMAISLQEKGNTDSEKTENNSTHISELLLQTQKLAEERAEGSIEEPATEGVYLQEEQFRTDRAIQYE